MRPDQAGANVRAAPLLRLLNERTTEPQRAQADAVVDTSMTASAALSERGYRGGAFPRRGAV